MKIKAILYFLYFLSLLTPGLLAGCSTPTIPQSQPLQIKQVFKQNQGANYVVCSHCIKYTVPLDLSKPTHR